MPTFIPYTQHQLNRVLDQIKDTIYTVLAPLEISAWRTGEPVPYSERFTGEELHLQTGDSWGSLFDCAWFRFRGRVPPGGAGQTVVLLLDVSGEMCVVDNAGVPVRGLTTVSSEFDFTAGQAGKRVLPLFNPAQGGEAIEIWADAGCNDLFGNLKVNGRVQEAAIAACHEQTRQLYYDYEVLLDSLKALPQDTARYEQVLAVLNKAAHLLQSRTNDVTATQARQVLAKELGKRGGDPSLEISAVGHAHLDLAWLWPLRETRRKGARTFATALANMELYPDYIFAASQAQLYQWIKEDHPALYAQVSQRVNEGRWELQGALWVEADTNLTGGESLVRQILYGQRFFRDEFGVSPDYIWLPDTFGYSAALPQIMRGAGLRYFSTQKLSWSLVNRFPHQSFHWQGLDGSSVPVHMLPEDTYNSHALPSSLAKIESNYRDKGVSNQALMVFGIGDGGGGPGEEHLERLVRLKNFAGLSPVRQELTSAFFERWAKDAPGFSTWSGELYLERHQGTLTTNAHNKWYNRRMEQALRELEWLAVIAGRLAGASYPAGFLEKTWKEVLLYQFHDILPGSSIKRVYDETSARYPLLLAEVDDLIRQYQRELAGQIDTSGAQKPVIVFNSLSWERTEWVKAGEGWQLIRVPSMGWQVADAAASQPLFPPMRAAPDRLENDRLRVRFGEDGTILSIFDLLAQREVLPAGEQANRLLVYRDLGDAWDIPLDYAAVEPQPLELVGAQAWVDGPYAVLQQEYRLGHSTLTQVIRLAAGSPVLEFDTRLTWRETQSMLRASFPVAIQAMESTAEIQFGHIRRPTHSNTTWDLAREEVTAQKWADLSQHDYGVALLNDSKYGHKIKGHVLDLALLRSVPYPGPRLVKDEDVMPGEPHAGYTDQSDHEFRYALLPHSGGPVEGGVIQAGYQFNYPLRTQAVEPHPGQMPASGSILQIDNPGVIVEGIKQAEDDQGTILRLYESAGGSAITHLHFGFKVGEVVETDLLEAPRQALKVEQNSVKLTFRPFEIKTVRVSELSMD
jgi:alpha-mannosidase